MSLGRATRGLLSGALLGLSLGAFGAGCAAPESPPPLVDPATAAVPAPDLGARLRSARERVTDAIEAQRADLASVRSAQEAVRRVVGHVRSSLDGMQAWIDSDGLAIESGKLGALRDRGDALLEQADAVLAQVDAVLTEFDAFEAQALDQLDSMERAPRAAASAGTARLEQRLGDLVERAQALGDLVVPILAASDAQALASARLGEDSQSLRDEVRRLQSINEPMPMKSILRDPDNDVEVTKGPGFSTEPVRSELDAAAAAAAAAWSTDQVAELVTSQGSLVLEFFPDVAPRHVENFLALARSDFYDGLTFHRVVPNFVVQAGCPVGDGSGGPGYEIDNEFNSRRHVRGTLSMARMAHPDSAGSQFFLCLKELPDLDGRYTVFGRLVAGDDVLAAIEELGTISGQTLEPVILRDVVLRERRPEERPADANDG